MISCAIKFAVRLRAWPRPRALTTTSKEKTNYYVNEQKGNLQEKLKIITIDS